MEFYEIDISEAIISHRAVVTATDTDIDTLIFNDEEYTCIVKIENLTKEEEMAILKLLEHKTIRIVINNGTSI